MKKLIILIIIVSAIFVGSNSTVAQNTDCLGVTKLATEGVFTDGYIYKFTTVGTDVTVSFELLDNKAGLVAFIFTYNPNFTEVAATNIGGKKYSKTFSGQTVGANFKVACKFAYAGGQVVTKIFTYVVGSSCSDTAADTELPAAFTVTKGAITYHSVELLLNATDNSGTVLYEITNGTTKFATTGTSGVQKSYVISGLTAATPYAFSVVAKDVSDNAALNSPVSIAATTSVNTSTECAGSYTDAQQGDFNDGYNYTFTTVGTDVTVTFELLDNKTGVEAFMWTYNPNFAEVATTLVSGKKFTKTFTGQTLDAKFKVACKFAFTGGMSVTKMLTYTVGNNCGGSTGSDSEIPTLFSAIKGAVTGNSVELLLNATDNSGAVIYTITYGITTLTVNGTSGVQKSCIISGLAATTAYTFTVVAKDANDNAAANIPLVVSATTDVALAGLATIDFESVGQDWSYTVFSNGAGGLDAPTNLSVPIANPSATGINNSTSCAKFIEDPTAAPWGGFFSDNIGSITFNATNKIVKVMVYKDKISPFGVKFEGPGGNPAFEVLVPNTKTNEWELLTFDFSSKIGQTVTRLVFLPDFPSTRTLGGTIYIDNISFSDGITALNSVSIDKNVFTCFPNPIMNQLTVNAKSEMSQVIVRNLLGQNVKLINVNGLEKTIELNDISTGNYFVTVKLANGHSATQKIVKL